LAKDRLMIQAINFTLNGVQQHGVSCRADMTVLEWLRGEAMLRGTKEGCAEGDCGACSVLVKRAGSGPNAAHQPANSCIMLMGQLDGAELVTVEGLSSADGTSHVVQEKMAENGSSQCGFCTPGIAVSLAGLIDRNSNPSEADIHDALAGNLCRCTGYKPIVEAAKLAKSESVPSLPSAKAKKPSHQAGCDDSAIFAPTKLSDLLKLKKSRPKAVLLAGGTDLSLSVAHAKSRWPQIISTRNVRELRQIMKTKTQLILGGAVTWEEALGEIDNIWPSFALLIRRFGSAQIRSMGTVAGNIANASPIGDGPPALLALNASLVLASVKGTREIPIEKFFLGYRKSALKAGEVISAIKIPLPAKSQQMRVYKVSKRYDQDISTVCGAFNLTLKRGKVVDARIAFGGMAATPVRCFDIEKELVDREWDDETIELGKERIRQSFSPMSDMRGSAEYRSMVAGNLIERFALDIAGHDVEVMEL